MTMTRHGIAALAIATLAGLADGAQAGDAPALFPDNHGVLFFIGTEDRSRNEFKFSDWTGISQHTCTVGIDCDAASFPARLTAAYAAERNDPITVERVIISFNLAKGSEDLVLVVARYGYEPSVIRFDRDPPLIVTRDMMDPPLKEEYLWGRFELPLGPAAAGLHEIELSVLNEEIENGRHSLDAIILKSAAPDS